MRNIFLLLAFISIGLHAQQRETKDLSNFPWNITLDKKVNWNNDHLYLPPVNIKTLSVNIPTGGWDLLNKPNQSNVQLPATVEQYLWGWNGQTYGVTGNYVGVSWFSTKCFVPSSWKNKHITLNIESVRFRAEIFINKKLVGYDLINSTPFQLDITDYIQYGAENRIDFRITDPNGNFNWKDSQVYSWGDYWVNPSHGFGGITGKVSLAATSKLYIDDVFVENTPKYSQVIANLAINNLTGEKVENEKMRIEVTECKTGKTVYQAYYPIKEFSSGISTRSFKIHIPKAKLWSVETPNLYNLTASIRQDSINKRFGFRWFEIKKKKGDCQFYLNGKRIVLRTSISWGFWPENGITPSDSLARRQVEDAKALGLNMLNFHRSIGQTSVLDYADELGLLYFEEPGGNQYPANRFNDHNKQSEFYFAYRNEKLARMIKRDRSHPSLIIYNLHNERGAYPQTEDYAEMRMAHKLDPSRILTYNSSNGNNPIDQPNARFKLHMLPNDTTFYDYGWWDNHHAGGPGVYHDKIYQGKDNYLRYSDHKDEIIYWGEEGAIGTPPRLQLIRNEILKSGTTKGWEAQDYLNWYDAYNSFLTNQGFHKAFPSVDSLTKAMGNVAYYYQGRVIENIRMCNTVDAYAINGWESMKLENHSGIVDNYRHLKGDPNLIARYNKPLYLAVKMNHKVLSVGDTTTVDIYIVNEKNLKGSYQLNLTAYDQNGKIIANHKCKVKIAGGTTYGENLITDWKIMASNPGYLEVKAELIKNRQVVTRGNDQCFAVQLDATNISSTGSIADSTGILARFLQSKGIKLANYTGRTPKGDYLLVGAYKPEQWGSGKSDILEWVYQGHTLIIVDNPVEWANYLCDKEVLDFRGEKVLGRSWYGGNFFNREDPIFKGLPQNVVFNWEYQCFSAYNRRRIGLRVFNGETLVGCVSDHRKEVYSALSIIPAGCGKIILTTLDIPACLRSANNARFTTVDVDGMNDSMNSFITNKKNEADVVGQQLLLNMLRE